MKIYLPPQRWAAIDLDQTEVRHLRHLDRGLLAPARLRRKWPTAGALGLLRLSRRNGQPIGSYFALPLGAT